MVQGLPAVDWKKPENNAKLIAAVLALFPGTPDCKKIAAVFGESASNSATPWCQDHGNSRLICCTGPNVPASAVSYRLSTLRKEGASFNLRPSTDSFSTPAKINKTTKRATPSTKQNKFKGKARKRGGILSDDTRWACSCNIESCTEPSSDNPDIAVNNDSDDEESAAETDDGEAPVTPAPSAKRQKTMNGAVSKRVSPRKGTKTDYKKLDDPFVTMNNATDEDGNNVFGEPSGIESEDTYAIDGSFKEAAVKMEEAV